MMKSFFTLIAVLAFCTCRHTFAEPNYLHGVTRISAREGHTCAVLTDTSVACWGSNEWGELGNYPSTESVVPVAIYLPGWPRKKLIGITDVQVGTGTTCALHGGTGEVFCWGFNSSVGELGNGTADPTSLPSRVAISERVKAISTGYDYSCALLDNGIRSIRCWGSNEFGQLGDGSNSDRQTPVDVMITETDGSKKILSGVTQISAGGDHTCAILDDTSATCWGNNTTGQLGNGTYVKSFSPITVVITEADHSKTVLTGVIQISAGWAHTCATLSNLTAACWGDNGTGELGEPSIKSSTTAPTAVAGLGVQQISAGKYFTCAVIGDWRTACWGDNSRGELGDGSFFSTRTFNILPTIARAKMIATSLGTWSSNGKFDYYACAALDDANFSAECWGASAWGRLGNGYDGYFSGYDFPSPQPVLEGLVNDEIFADGVEPEILNL